MREELVIDSAQAVDSGSVCVGFSVTAQNQVSDVNCFFRIWGAQRRATRIGSTKSQSSPAKVLFKPAAAIRRDTGTSFTAFTGQRPSRPMAFLKLAETWLVEAEIAIAGATAHACYKARIPRTGTAGACATGLAGAAS